MKVQFQKYKALWIAGTLLGLLALALAFLAFRARAKFSDASTRLKNAQSSIERLQRAQPYPSRENVAIASDNVEQLRTFRDSLLETMSRNQIEPLPVEPAAFPLGQALTRLRGAARQNQVTLKADESFGFSRYVEHGVPASATNEIQRLTVQLQAIEHVCRILFTSGISELEGVRRTTFEAPGTDTTEDGRAGGRRRLQAAPVAAAPMPMDPVEEESGLFSPERIQLAFRCEPKVVWRVLNALAADRAFIVVSDLRIETVGLSAETPAARAAAPVIARPTDPAQPPPGPVPHRERIVAGEEMVSVELTLDIYRFQLPEPEDDGLQAAGGPY